MPLRDYIFTKEARKNNKLRKISVPSMLKKIDCTPANRLKCQGYCCNLTLACRPQFHPEEIKKLPPRLKKFIESDGKVTVIDNKCPLVEDCLKNPNIKSVDCMLAPLGFNKKGTLIIKRWVWLKPCPFYGKGKPIYIAMKDCLIDAFGEKIYNDIVQEVKNVSKKHTN